MTDSQARIVINNLVQYSPNKMPKSHTRYGEKRIPLKDQLETIRENWFVGKTAKVMLTSAEKKECMERLPWMKSYIAGLRDLRKKKLKANRTRIACKAWRKRKLVTTSAAGSSNSSYSSVNFTDEHEHFKDLTSNVFAKNVRKMVKSTRWIVLDDFPRNSKQELRTLTAMKKAGLKVNQQAYLCNPALPPIQVATRTGIAGVAQMTCEDAMRSVWKHMTFGAAYLDLCAGSTKYIRTVLGFVMPNLQQKCVVALTITSRDRTGQKMHHRLSQLTTRMKKTYKMSPLAVSEQGNKHHLRFKKAAVVTMYFAR